MPGLRLESVHLGRRTVLALGAAAAATAALPEVTHPDLAAAADLDPAPFALGVASGDPDHHSVVLWTRLVVDPTAADGGVGTADAVVEWEIARDSGFRQGRRTGRVTARADDVHTVHVVADDLRPDSWYFYRFTTTYDGAAARSRVGRTRTLPVPGRGASELTFGFVSCQSWAGGSFNACRDLAGHDLDLVIHLGDYIYETAKGTLAEFRRLHTQYKTSPDLREAHARFPFVLTFDDHEVQNNYAGDVPGGAGDGLPFLERRANAYRAYYEHLPLRPAAQPVGSDMLLYRRFRWSDLAEFSVLDTRQYRDDQACGDGRKVRCESAEDPARTLAGPEQEQWLLAGLSASKARWNVIAQQTIMAQFDYDLGPDLVVNLDQWDGYPAARQRILDHLVRERVTNPIVLGGDWHTAWCNDLLADFDDPGSATVATEFVGTSISSGAGWDADVRAGLAANPHVKFYNGSYRGWTMCHVTPQAWTTTYRVVTHPSQATATAHTVATYRVASGTPGAVRVGDPDGLSGVVLGRRSGGGVGPVGGAEIVITDGTTRVASTTAADGEWLAFVPPGTWQVTVNAVGHELVTRSVVVAEDPVRLDIELTPISGARVSHRVVPGGLAEAKAADLVLENDRLAVAVSVATQDGQLSPVTPGKVLDAAALGRLDQLDWINLPWVSDTLPAGATAWQIRTVRSDEVAVVEAGPDRAVVEARGVCTTVPGLAVVTRYTLAPGSGWLQVDTTFSTTGDSVTVWVGDAIDHDGAGQRSVVAGHGLVTTPYAQQDVYRPTGDWIAMTGSDRQVYALHYEGDFEAYGNGNWIQSRRQVTVAPGTPVMLRRRLVVAADGASYGLD